MSANVESLFYVSNEVNGRFVPWHGLGQPLEVAPNSKEALVAAGLDWEVEPRDVYWKNNAANILIPNVKANVRTSDNTCLGVVTDKYKIVQNRDAFAFTDELIGENVKYETAGSLRNGKTIWLLAKMPEQKILDDTIQDYICFTNTHDGTGAVKAFMTNTRVVCMNTLSIALREADRVWSVRHVGNIQEKIKAAQETLQMAANYNEKLNEYANIIVEKKFNDDDVKAILDKLFPLKDDMSARKAGIETANRNFFMQCYNQDDIARFKGTGWGIVNAAADFASHVQPSRNTADYKANRFGNILSGNNILNEVVKIVNAA